MFPIKLRQERILNEGNVADTKTVSILQILPEEISFVGSLIWSASLYYWTPTKYRTGYERKHHERERERKARHLKEQGVSSGQGGKQHAPYRLVH